MNAIAVRLGWPPFFPQVDKKNPMEFYKEALEAWYKIDNEVKDLAVKQFREDKLNFAINDVGVSKNHLKMVTVYRGNLIGTSMLGQELALKRWLGTHHNVIWDEESAKNLVNEIEWHDEIINDKLDFLANLNIRMDSTVNYYDVILPAAF